MILEKAKRSIHFLFVAFVLCLIAIMLVPGYVVAGEKVCKWKMPSFLPRGTAAEKVREQWCKEVKEATGGRIQIAYYGGGELIPPLQMWDAVSNGTIDIAFSYGAYWRGKTAVSMLSQGLPFTVESISDFYALLYEHGLENIIRKAYAKQGIYLLKVLPAFQNVMIGKHSFSSVEDLRKYKIRAGGPFAEMFKAAGVPTVYIPSVDIYPSLQRGVIDFSIEGPISYFYDLGVHEVAKYLMWPGTGIGADEIIMNMNTWKSLPKDLQMTFSSLAAELGERIAANYRSRDVKCLEVMKGKYKVETVALKERERRRLAMYALQAADKVAEKDADFGAGLNVVKSYLRMMGKID